MIIKMKMVFCGDFFGLGFDIAIHSRVEPLRTCPKGRPEGKPTSSCHGKTRTTCLSLVRKLISSASFTGFMGGVVVQKPPSKRQRIEKVAGIDPVTRADSTKSI